jgi:Circularly permutated YpsA SLOG family
MKIISGGQTGVDRAALDVAIERGMSWGGWCPKGGWAEDLSDPPGLLNKYPGLRETPSSQPEQRTEWNVRDSDAVLIIANRKGLTVSNGTRRAQEWADHYGKPLLIIDAGQPDTAAQVARWLKAQRKRFGAHMTLGIGGPRESEAPGIYESTRLLMASVLDRPVQSKRPSGGKRMV